MQTVKTTDAYNRILAKDIFLEADVPSHRTSAKDGYAMLASDGKVRTVIKARPMFAEFLFTPDTCVRVRSGDPIPKGANTVVTPKNVKILDKGNDNDYDYFNSNDKEYKIEILVELKINDNIRNAGYLIKGNRHILKQSTRIGRSELSILTLCGINTIGVITICVGVLSVRNKFENPFSRNTLNLGYIYDSNTIFLTSFLKENGFNYTDFGILNHQFDVIIKEMKNALNEVDVLVIMGLVKDKDTLKEILAHFKADIHFDCLDMKPGKSTTFATCMVNNKQKFLLCMSTNPANVPTVAHVVLLPLLNLMHNNCSKPITMLTRINSLELYLRPKFLWATVQWNEKETFSRASCLTNQDQNIMDYQKANALLMLPKRTLEMPKLECPAFVSAMFFGRK
ncbi:Gephyrin [Cyphomyrmex costatus]|uniref:molybdopterin adenylyltransferase n=1 Tax=Cyphomyrmex costatus TaxID=456900 RepID=A0A195CEI6_9HYME|nr:Gephyrin [Cyphomyrmex costatus]